MAKRCRNFNLLLLIGLIFSVSVFYGCGGGGTSDDPLPAGPAIQNQISGKITAPNVLTSLLPKENTGIRGAIVAGNVEVYIEGMRSTHSTRSDAAGNFLLENVPNGTHNVVALIKTNSGNTYKVRSGQVEVSSSQTTTEVPTLLLQQATRIVNGVIKDANGNPIPNAPLMLWGETFYTNSNGEFTSPLMPPGVEANIISKLAGYQESTIPVSFSSTTPPYIEQMVVPTSSTNRPPTARLKATSYEISPNQQVTLTAEASDPDGQTLSYTWSHPSGTLATSANNLSGTWTAPGISTIATITFTAKDPSGLTSVAKVTIKVGSSGGNQPSNAHPVVLSIDTATSTFLNNADYQLTANATDSNGDALTYFWSTTQGTVSPTDQVSTTWRTPNVSNTTYVQVTVLVSDNRGGTANRTATFTVSPNPNPPPNQSPVVTITSPASGSLVPIGKVNFSGSATDNEDGQLPATSLTWYQSEEGKTPVIIGQNTSAVQLYMMTPATYVVTLEASDYLGAISKQTIAYRVNATPTATITAPANNAVYQLGQAVTFTGTGSDIEDGTITSANHIWTIPVAGNLTGPSQTVSNLPAGNQTIYFETKDSLSSVSDKSSVKVYVNTPPVITEVKSDPANDSLQSSPVKFTVAVNDIDETSLANSGITWFDGSTQIGVGPQIQISSLTVGTHNIEVRIADSMGGSTSSTTQILINERPTMTITSPANGAIIPVGQTITFSGNGTSSLGAISSGTMNWQDGFGIATSPLKTGYSTFTHTYDASAIGKHFIRLTGEDSLGASSYTQHIVYVNATPTVQITAPASGTRFNTGAEITFTAAPTDSDSNDTLSVRWLDSATEIGTGQVFKTSSLSTGNHNIFCEVTDMHGVKSLASISVLVNTLPTGNITYSATQYATAPSNIPVFLTTGTNQPITLTANSADSDGSITATNIKWYINSTGNPANDVSAGTFADTGETLLNNFPVGISTITLRLYDDQYPDFEDQASATYKMAVYVWRSISYDSSTIPSPSTITSVNGDAGNLLISSVNAGNLRVTQHNFSPGVVYGGESLLKAKDFTVGSYTTAVGLALINDITAIGITGGGALEIASFTDENIVHTPYNPGLVNPTSMTTEGSVLYVADLDGTNPDKIMMINPITQAEAHFITNNGGTGDTFSNPRSIRYSDRDYGKIFLADTNNNRVCRFNTALAGGLAPIPVNNPEDIAFSSAYIFAVNKTANTITILDPLTQATVMTFGGTSGAGAGEFTNPDIIYFNEKALFIFDDNRLQIIQTGLDNFIK